MSAARLSEHPLAAGVAARPVGGDAGGPNLVWQILFDKYWGEIASRERNYSCSISGGVNCVVIAVVALIAIGPKELPGVLRMVGQWMGKARKMAAEFQGQFQEAMREAEMADLKKSFDEVKEAASGFTTGNLMTSLEKDVSKALDIDDIDKPVASATDTPAVEPPVIPTGDRRSTRRKRRSRKSSPRPRRMPRHRSRWRSCRRRKRNPRRRILRLPTPDVLKDAKAS